MNNFWTEVWSGVIAGLILKILGLGKKILSSFKSVFFLQTVLKKTIIDNPISLLITGSFSTKDKTYNSQINSTSFSCSLSSCLRF
jgi:hypothetical protein